MQRAHLLRVRERVRERVRVRGRARVRERVRERVRVRVRVERVQSQGKGQRRPWEGSGFG